MDKLDRFQLLHRAFKSHRYPISVSTLAEKLECSEKTVKRAIQQMSDFLGAPLEYFPESKGWQYKDGESALYELPGLWLTGSELQSLALLIHLTEQIGEGMLAEELGVIENQVEKLLEARGIRRSAFEQHVRILPLSSRYMANQAFATVCEALILKKQLDISYRDYASRKTDRSISPQTLVYYRENWYVDAWCHLRKDLRTFSVARIERISLEARKAQVIAQQRLSEHFSNSYGIFAGGNSHTAKLRFGPKVAREIAMQQWHPAQQFVWEGKDYVLKIPYSDDRELIQDILRHTPHVRVEAPAALKKAVKIRLQQGLELYLNKGVGWL